MEKVHRSSQLAKKALVPPAKTFELTAAAATPTRVTNRKGLTRIQEAEWQPHVLARLQGSQSEAEAKKKSSSRKKKSADDDEDGGGDATGESPAGDAKSRRSGGKKRPAQCPRCRLDAGEWGFCGVTGERHTTEEG